MATTATGLQKVNESIAWGNPDATHAQIIKQQSDYSRSTFKPIEDRLIDTALGSTEAEAQRAGEITREQFMNQRAQFDRSMQRRGLALTPAQEEALARRMAITQSKGIATAENIARRGLDDRNRSVLGQLAGLGRGVAQSANSSLNSAANAFTSRQAVGKQLNSQKRTSKVMGAASGAYMGWKMSGGTPWGAAIGGVLGYLSS